MSDLVRNPEDWFSRAVAHMVDSESHFVCCFACAANSAKAYTVLSVFL